MAIISFATTFDLIPSPNPQVFFEDTTDWAGQGIPLLDVNGSFKIVSPSGSVIYDNTDFSDLGSDIDIFASLASQQSIILPVDTDGLVEQGNYTIIYTVYDNNALLYYTQTNIYNYKYVAPEVCILHKIDCVTPNFKSIDDTNYDVAGVSPTKTVSHTLYYPNGSAGQGSPIVNAAPTITTNTFYQGTQTSEISADLEYLFPDGLKVIDQISGDKEALVDCTYVCSIYCCLHSVQQRAENAKGVNEVKYNQEQALFEQIMSLAMLAKLAIECGKADDVNSLTAAIKALANCTDDCDCGDDLSLVTGLGCCGGGEDLAQTLQIGNVTGGTNIIVSNGDQIGVGTPNPNLSSVVDMTSTTQGLLIPRMTTAERLAIPAPAPSLIVYDTDLDDLMQFDASTTVNEWVSFGAKGVWVQQDTISDVDIPAGYTFITVGNVVSIGGITGAGTYVDISGGLNQAMRFDVNGYPTASTTILNSGAREGSIYTQSFFGVPVGAVNGDWWFEDQAGITYLVRKNSIGAIQKVQLT